MSKYAELSARITYSPLTGQFVWASGVGKRFKAGHIAGSIDRRGYWIICFRGKRVSAHRLAWYIMTGREPGVIDHRNLVPSDNRFCNLREATATENNANVGARRGSSLPKGVTKHRNGKYQAQVKKDGKNWYLGLFPTPDEASRAYATKARELFGDFARAA